jgi:hypothetical protein
VQKLKWVCIFLAFSPSLYAEADGPDFWQVRDVEKNHVLNVRRYADDRAPKTGQIPYDAQCIKNMGCKGGLTYNEFVTLSEADKQRISKQRPRWCHVSYQGVTGWVAGRYLQEAPCAFAAAEDSMPSAQGVDPYNHRYLIENEAVFLHDGSSGKTIEGSAAIIITEVAKKPLYIDLNGDGFKDAVLILMQQTGGIGTFYYLAVASGSASSGAPVIESYFLGDRIKVETVSYDDNVISVDYLDRATGQSMAVKPEVRMNKQFKLAGDKLIVHP